MEEMAGQHQTEQIEVAELEDIIQKSAQMLDVSYKAAKQHDEIFEKLASEEAKITENLRVAHDRSTRFMGWLEMKDRN